MEKHKYPCGCWEIVNYKKVLSEGTVELGDTLEVEYCKVHKLPDEEDL